MKNIMLYLGLLLCSVGLAVKAGAEDSKQGMYYTLGAGVGIGGYDPVSYFSNGGPKKGHIMRSAVHDGVTYRFASDTNRKAFEMNPEKYLPAYGGWCAWALAKLGKKVDIDPLSYKIIDGKLLLFYRDLEIDTRKEWTMHEKEYLPMAETNWEKIKG